MKILIFKHLNEKYGMSFFNNEIENYAYLSKNELENLQDQIEDILLETLDT